MIALIETVKVVASAIALFAISVLGFSTVVVICVAIIKLGGF